MLLTSRLVAALALAGTAIASLQIIPGGTWTASGTNQHVQAHGGGIIQVGSTYYWIGENKLNGSAFQSINCYSSENLVEWTYVGELLSRQSSGDLGPNRVVERPKVLYNEATRKYVMWMHIDDSSYKEAKTGVATSSSVCGKYTYLGSFQPLGQQSRDMGLFKDDDGSAYLLTEDRPNGLRINRLTSDYTNVTSTVHLFPEHIEAPAMYKKNGVYFMFGSQLTGWSTNDNKYTTSTSISGPWSSWANFAPSGSNTFNSQTTFILGVGDTVMYMGDRWVPSNLMASTYIWLPLTISGTTATLVPPPPPPPSPRSSPLLFTSALFSQPPLTRPQQNQVNWILPLQGIWTPGPTETNPEAESSTNALSNGARVISCSGCSGGMAVGWIGGPSDGTLRIVGVESSASTRSTIRVKYENGDSSQRYALVSVNGKTQVLAFLPSGGSPASSTLHADLQSGSGNTVTFSAYAQGYGPDVDRLMVPKT
ncbi:hypothetical protein KXV51_004952 [Aspergillus fumigatus]|nr:hypothetical protein KXX55_004756 [Aspergillus fumigatus]KAH2228285.1 hypothetical protein KXW71_009174 [Aspergillus fumigatus]KAH2368922.1 hypothetical protein KXV98_009897 [Aspergillus fumigatus]KAH2673922.1 hypothetical protein KXV51_004952 [Aspergillus fumigatus]KAH2760033.1 hypothetical protein KXV66_009583 [Aspergillus fumigatus]